MRFRFQRRIRDVEMMAQKLLDPIFYVQKYPEAKSYRGGLLRHYLDVGFGKSYIPSLLIDPLYIERRYRDRLQGLDPIRFFMCSTSDMLSPSLFFAADYYVECTAEAIRYPGGPFQHYLDIGRKELRNPAPLIDPVFVKKKYHVVIDKDDPVEFFLRNVINLRISPSPFFDTEYYLSRNLDVARSGANPLAHYLQHGEREGRAPNKLFSPAFYQQYKDQIPRRQSALEHYSLVGGFSKLNPSAEFDSDLYLRLHPDVRRANINPLYHYLRWGLREGRALRPAGRALAVPASASASVSGLAGLPSGWAAVEAVRALPALGVERPRVSLVVATRNGAGLLDAMLRSFLAVNRYPDVEMVVVDHASSDETLALLERWKVLLPLRVIARETNYSFSASCNLGVSLATGEIVVLLNNDVVFHEDVLAAMLQALGDPGVGAVGLKQLLGQPCQSEAPRVYHMGIRYRWDVRENYLKPFNVAPGPGDGVLAQSLAEFPAVTASMMMCRRADYLAVGGLEEAYFYGLEDVDFCCKLRFGLDKVCISLNQKSVFHNESTTRNLEEPDTVRPHRINNRRLLRERWGARMRRDYRAKVLSSDGSYTGRRKTVGIAVTTTDFQHGAGDLFTAFGLGSALRRAFGWEVRYLPIERWYEAGGLDVIVAMRDDFDVDKLKNPEAHLILVAWIRNWIERWIERPSFPAFDLYLCSSQFGIDFIKQKRDVTCTLFPIAVDPDIFARGVALEAYAADYVFTGNYWKAEVPREFEAFDPAGLPYRLRIFGKGWDQYPRFSPYSAGFVHYAELPKVYASAPITIDDTVTHVTKLWGSLNSRVFEALSAGSLVLTNNAIGAAELFENKLPVWSTAEELAGLVERFMSHPSDRESLQQDLRARVIAHHTYDHRARLLHGRIVEAAHAIRVAIKCPAPTRQQAPAWGDYHFALALRRALMRLGCQVRIDCLDAWSNPRAMADDVAIVLRGLSAYEPQPDQVNICWIISHPKQPTAEELNGYDHVFAASEHYAAVLRDTLRVPVDPLLQCSDPFVFRPPAPAGVPAQDLDPATAPSPILFVGNSRKARRPIVEDAVALGLGVSIYGQDWEDRAPPALVKGTHIPNEDLHAYYASAAIVLNDHWSDMAELGFVSNRLFDVALSGGFAISDRIEGAEVFEGLLVTYNDQADLADKVRSWTDQSHSRHERSQRVRDIVLAKHTFDHRAATIMAVIHKTLQRKLNAALAA